MKIYIIAHKETEFPALPSIYQPLQVGTELHGKLPGNWAYDNDGENISAKNLSYNELTGLYWMWKNAEEDVVGLCHYRRYFVSSSGKINNLLFGKQTGFLQDEKIRKVLETHDMIVHNKTIFMEGCGKQFLRTQKHPEDLELTGYIIKRDFPEYADDFEKVCSRRTCHLLNVVIAGKELLNRYCQWLFDVLETVEKELKARGEEDFSRRLGMIGERLLDVWIAHNHVRVKECFMINTERNDWKPW